MTTPDLRSLTSGSADFSEEIDEAENGAVPFVTAGTSVEAWKPGMLGRYCPPPQRAVPTIDQELPPVHEVKPKGSKRRLAELKASVRRLSEMVPNELERIRRRRVQWLGDL